MFQGSFFIVGGNEAFYNFKIVEKILYDLYRMISCDKVHLKFNLGRLFHIYFRCFNHFVADYFNEVYRSQRFWAHVRLNLVRSSSIHQGKIRNFS